MSPETLPFVSSSNTRLSLRFSPDKKPLRCLQAGVFIALLAPASRSDAAPQNPIVVGQTRFSVLTPNCIRIEQARDGKFVDAPSLFAVNRAARGGFKLKTEGQNVSIDTGAMELRFTNDGAPLSSANLSATIRGGTHWTPGAKNRGNLGGTIRTLDAASGPVDVGEGVLSRDGWALIDNSKDPLLTQNWVQARPASAGTDWYL